MDLSLISQKYLATPRQITIYLIAQQLKSRRFFDDLHNIGLGHYDFQPNLDHLILKNVDLDDGTDKTYALYTKILEGHSQKLKPEFRAIQRQAVRMYNDLIKLKRRLSNKPR